MSRVSKRIVIIIVFLTIGGLVVASWLRPPATDVSLVTVRKGRVEFTVSNTRAGSVKARQRAKVAPATSGQVARLEVSKGDRVEEGAVLLELWNKDLKAELQLARNGVAAAEARLTRECLNTEEAEREAKRQKQLHERGVASDEEVDRALTAAEAGRATCTAAEAEVEVARSRAETIEAAISRTILLAPFSGTVAEVNAELGEVVAPSPPGIPTPPAVELIDTSEIHVSAPIDEVDAPHVKKGMNVRIHLDAFPQRTFAGMLRRVAPYVRAVEKQARTVEVEVVFDSGEQPSGLLPGYSADVEIIVEVHEQTLRLPSQCVYDGSKILVRDPWTGVLEERTLETGIRNWNHVEVQGGLAEGEQVVLTPGRQGVEPGTQTGVESLDGSPDGASP